MRTFPSPRSSFWASVSCKKALEAPSGTWKQNSKGHHKKQAVTQLVRTWSKLQLTSIASMMDGEQASSHGAATGVACTNSGERVRLHFVQQRSIESIGVLACRVAADVDLDVNSGLRRRVTTQGAAGGNATSLQSHSVLPAAGVSALVTFWMIIRLDFVDI